VRYSQAALADEAAAGLSLQLRRNFLLALVTIRAQPRVMCGISGHSLPVGIFAARALENARVSGRRSRGARCMTQT
jgi:hypothetical protein